MAAVLDAPPPAATSVTDLRARFRDGKAALMARFLEARPSAPEGLTSEQEKIWNDTVCRLPADFFPRELHALLAEYCRAVTRARFIADEIDEFKPEWMEAPGGIERYAKLVATSDTCVRSMTALARALRITNQSRLRPETAARQAMRGYNGPYPWDDYSVAKGV